MSDEAQITIRRGKSYADRLRAYKVVLDGLAVASVRAGESVTVPVTAGSHAIRLRVDWCGSEEVRFEAQVGESIAFECGNSLTGWRIFLVLFYVIFRSNQYLWLRRAA